MGAPHAEDQLQRVLEKACNVPIFTITLNPDETHIERSLNIGQSFRFGPDFLTFLTFLWIRECSLTEWTSEMRLWVMEHFHDVRCPGSMVSMQ